MALTMSRNDWIALVVVALAVAATAVVGSFAAIDSADQYGNLEQPGWAPPSWLFGPVWTILYVFIAVAGFLLWKEDGWSTDGKLWAAQLFFNALWTPFFFAWELRLVALVWILALDVLVAWLIVRTWPRWPALFMAPYLAWILFATALNAAVWWLNR